MRYHVHMIYHKNHVYEMLFDVSASYKWVLSQDPTDNYFVYDKHKSQIVACPCVYAQTAQC